MIIPSGAVRVLVATRPVDFRKGADGLCALVQESCTPIPTGANLRPARDHARSLDPGGLGWPCGIRAATRARETVGATQTIYQAVCRRDESASARPRTR